MLMPLEKTLSELDRYLECHNVNREKPQLSYRCFNLGKKFLCNS